MFDLGCRHAEIHNDQVGARFLVAAKLNKGLDILVPKLEAVQREEDVEWASFMTSEVENVRLWGRLFKCMFVDSMLRMKMAKGILENVGNSLTLAAIQQGCGDTNWMNDALSDIVNAQQHLAGLLPTETQGREGNGLWG